MTGRNARPKFSTAASSDGEASGSESRSTSCERSFDTAYHKANPRARTTSFTNNHTVLNIPPGIDEDHSTDAVLGGAVSTEPAGDAEASSGNESSRIYLSPAKTRGPVPYGTFEPGGRSGSHRFLQLNSAGPQPSPALVRNASIFKLSGMIDNKEGSFEKYRMPEEQLKTFKKPIRHFYENQNEILDGFAEVDEILENTRAMALTGELAPIVPSKASISADREEARDKLVKLAINVNFLVNFILLGAKIGIVIISSSMSLIASTVDSAMDFLSTVIIFGTSKIIDHKDWKTTYNYPTGKRRMEPMGVVVFSVFMIASFLQVFIESAQRLLSKDLETVVIPLIGKIVMIATIVVKLVVWLWCRSIKNSSVEALTQDAENDIVFNFFSLLFPFVGEQLGWPYLDPLGGLLLSVYIMVEWTETLLDNVKKLSGRRASPAQHQRVAYLITRFSPLIRGIQHLTVYNSGDGLVVETDIVLPPNTSLTVGHNVGESAQYGLEQLDGVDRAFVHLDTSPNKLSGHIER